MYENIYNTKSENLELPQDRGILEFFGCLEEAKVVLIISLVYSFKSRILNIGAMQIRSIRKFSTLK